MNDGEIRQAMTALETYNRQLESLNRQVQVLQASMDDILRARDTLRALKDSKEGDEMLIPIGGSAYINVVVGKKMKAVVNVGNRVSVEKNVDDALEFIMSSGEECSKTLKDAIDAMGAIEKMATELTDAIQNEYRNRKVE